MNEIDYILSDRIEFFKDVGVVNRIQVGSDHPMLRVRIRVKFQQEHMKPFCNKTRMLKIDVSKKYEYLEELNRAFSQSEFDKNNSDLDTIQRAIADSLIGTAKKFNHRVLQGSLYGPIHFIFCWSNKRTALIFF